MKTINVRDLQRNMKMVADEVENGQAFIVLKNAKPIFEIQPIAFAQTKKKKKKHTQEEFIAALKKMQFHSGEKNLSGRIDEIVYK